MHPRTEAAPLSSPPPLEGARKASATRRRPARERLIAAADRLLYVTGLASTAVERIIDEAGIAKGTFYNHFRDKDELVAEYLSERHGRTMAALAAIESEGAGLVEKTDGLFDYVASQSSEEDFRGCAFVLAAAEDPGSGTVGSEWASSHKTQVNEVFQRFFRDAGFPDPRSAADQLSILYDGALVNGAIRPGCDAAEIARSMAHSLFG
jgi:AcrR family transcriptional regulator